MEAIGGLLQNTSFKKYIAQKIINDLAIVINSIVHELFRQHCNRTEQIHNYIREKCGKID